MKLASITRTVSFSLFHVARIINVVHSVNTFAYTILSMLIALFCVSLCFFFSTMCSLQVGVFLPFDLTGPHDTTASKLSCVVYAEYITKCKKDGTTFLPASYTGPRNNKKSVVNPVVNLFTYFVIWLFCMGPMISML